MKYSILLLFLMINTIGFSQQTDEDVSSILQNYLESLGDNKPENIDISMLEEEILAFHQNPINLNTAQKEDFEQFFFLSDHQIEQILMYRYQHIQFSTIYELQGVTDIDLTTAKLLSLCLYVETPEMLSANQLTHPHSFDWFTRFERKWTTEPSNTQYLGDPYRIMAKANATIKKKTLIGASTDKDYYEPWWDKEITTVDYYSAFYQYTPTKGVVRKVNLGDFQASFGQGVALCNRYRISKSSAVLNIRNKANGINKYSSIDEYNFFRGAGVTLGRKKWASTMFASINQLDATLDSNQVITGIDRDGYHRTELEINRKRSIEQYCAGTTVMYKSNRVELGLLYLQSYLSKPQEEPTELYKIHQFPGQNSYNISATYTFVYHRLMVFGEEALGVNNSYGLLNGLNYTIPGGIGFSLLHRKYSVDYYAPFAKPFSESGSFAGESGIYLGCSFSPLKKLQIATFYDYFEYQWLRFGVDAPSYGNEWMAQMVYQPNYSSSLTIKYSESNKQENMHQIENLNFVGFYHLHKIDIRYRFQLTEKISLESRLQNSNFRNDAHFSSQGIGFAQDVSYQCTKLKSKFSVRYLSFDTDDFSSALYFYEPDVLYGATSLPNYYEGSKWVFNIKTAPFRHFTFWLKYAHQQKEEFDFAKIETDELKFQMKISF